MDNLELAEEELEIIEERVYAIRPNKTQLKKEIAQVAAMAEAMTHLSLTQINQLGLPEPIQLAVIQSMKMPAKAARKRLLKYITGELWKIELAQIQEKLDRIHSKSVHAVREHQQAEQWRDKLIADETNESLTELLELYPAADSQQLKQWQRNAKKERATQKPAKSASLLYHYLKELLVMSSETEIQDDNALSL